MQALPLLPSSVRLEYFDSILMACFANFAQESNYRPSWWSLFHPPQSITASSHIRVDPRDVAPLGLGVCGMTRIVPIWLLVGQQLVLQLPSDPL